MAYDLKLAERIRMLLKGKSYVEKKMLGGVGFMVNGNLACGVQGDGLIVRVAPEKHATFLARPHTPPFDMTGRPMKGWLIVEAEGCRTEVQLKIWVREGTQFALSLPAKSA
jgi:TfoX/Sxy family transcriptional regulator of competence genes